MKLLITKQIVFFIAALFVISPLFGQNIDRIEPPFWWTNMVNQNLQLMIHGRDIGDLEISTTTKGITIVKTHAIENPNYLFVDLKLEDEVRAGYVNFQFSKREKVLLENRYELKARSANAAMKQGFTNKDVLYLVTPDRFINGDPKNDEVSGMLEGHDRSAEYGRHGGDIQGIMDHLDYVQDMGFTSIWLNPILENDQMEGSYHGYATTDYYKVDPRFGTNELYQKLSHTAKEMGIGMIMDIIVNHCGDAHWWMKDPPTSDWFNYQDKEFQVSNHRKYTLVDPYASKDDREKMVNGWFVKSMPDLNQNNFFLATYLIQNTIWWIEYLDLAGIRQDTYSYPFRDFMTDWTCAIKEEYPDMNIVGEEWIDDPAVISYWQEGKENIDGYTSCLPSLMDFPGCFAMHKGLTEEEAWEDGLVKIYENYAKDYHYPNPDNLVIFPDNHDMSRIFTQLNEDYDLYKMALGMILTGRGIPQIYYGTEILMSNPGTDSHGIIRTDFPGGWAGDKVNAFTGDGLTLQEKEAQEFCKQLLNWRKDKDVIHTGKMMHYHPDQGMYVYFRYSDDESIMVILNKNESDKPLTTARFAERIGSYTKGSDIITKQDYDITKQVNVPARSILILELN